jgi:hypothetical protein
LWMEETTGGAEALDSSVDFATSQSCVWTHIWVRRPCQAAVAFACMAFSPLVLCTWLWWDYRSMSPFLQDSRGMDTCPKWGNQTHFPRNFYPEQCDPIIETSFCPFLKQR